MNVKSIMYVLNIILIIACVVLFLNGRGTNNRLEESQEINRNLQVRNLELESGLKESLKLNRDAKKTLDNIELANREAKESIIKATKTAGGISSSLEDAGKEIDRLIKETIDREKNP